MTFKNLFLFVLVTATFSACNDSEPTPAQPYDNGILILNAGNFSDNNGTLSLLQRNSSVTKLDVFKTENTRSLSGGISGYTEVNNKGIILVDNSTAGKDLIEIVNASTFKSLSTTSDKEIENPRVAIKVSNSKAYVSCWDATGDFSNFYKNLGYIAVVDLFTNKITKKIPVQSGAESMILIGKEVFVGNSGSGKKVLSVIDIATESVSSSVDIGSNPEIIGLDNNNKLWVLAGGEFVKFNPSTKTVEERVKIITTNKAKTPSAMVMSKDKNSIIYTYSFYDASDNFKQKGETYSFLLSSSSATTDKPLIKRIFGGGLGVDPQTGNIYAGLIPSYKQAGFVFRFTSAGVLIDSVKAEIAPSKFFFKN